jgi:hypothetical protein
MMTTQFEALLEKVHEIHDLEKAAQLLSWDREVIMPRAGEEIRIQQMTTVRRLVHELFVTDEMGQLIEDAAAEVERRGGDGFAPSLVRWLQYDYGARASCLPIMCGARPRRAGAPTASGVMPAQPTTLPASSLFWNGSWRWDRRRPGFTGTKTSRTTRC